MRESRPCGYCPQLNGVFWFRAPGFRFLLAACFAPSLLVQVEVTPPCDLGSRALVLFGTQTGTAEELACWLADEAYRRRKLRTACMPMDAYDITKLPSEQLVLCVVSTTGDGDVPATMVRTWADLRRRDLPQGALRRLRFAVFGPRP